MLRLSASTVQPLQTVCQSVSQSFHWEKLRTSVHYNCTGVLFALVIVGRSDRRVCGGREGGGYNELD